MTKKKRYRAHFLGSGLESIKFVFAKAYTPGDAIEEAKEEYKRRDFCFDYCEIEAEEVPNGNI